MAEQVAVPQDVYAGSLEKYLLLNVLVALSLRHGGLMLPAAHVTSCCTGANTASSG